MQHSFAKTRHNAPKLAKTRQKLFDAPTKEIETMFGDSPPLSLVPVGHLRGSFRCGVGPVGQLRSMRLTTKK